MISKKIFLILFTALTFFTSRKVHGKVEKMKSYLKNYQVSNSTPVQRQVSIKFSGIVNGETSIEVKAFGKTFVLDLSVYFPKEDFEVAYMSKSSNHTVSYLNLKILLYHGQVRNVEHSYVIGSFSATNLFRGYIITDEVYCIEPNEEKKSIIVYKFKDIIAPGCVKQADGEGIDCAKTKYFVPWKPNKPLTQNYAVFGWLYDQYLRIFSELEAEEKRIKDLRKGYSDLKREKNATDVDVGSYNENTETNGTATAKTDDHDKSENVSNTDGNEKSHHGEKNKHHKNKEEKGDDDDDKVDDLAVSSENEIVSFIKQGNQDTGKKTEHSHSKSDGKDADKDLKKRKHQKKIRNSILNSNTPDSDKRKKDRREKKKNEGKTVANDGDDDEENGYFSKEDHYKKKREFVLNSSENDLDTGLAYSRHKSETHSSDQNNKTLVSDKGNSIKEEKNKYKIETDDNNDDSGEEIDLFHDKLKSHPKRIKLDESSTVFNGIPEYYDTSPTENNMDSFFKNISFAESAEMKIKSSYTPSEKHKDVLVKKKEERSVHLPTMQALKNKPVDLECNVQIVISPSIKEKFKNQCEDVIKDIYTQITLMNKIFKKLLLQKKATLFHLHFKIEEIDVYEDDFYNPFKPGGELENFSKANVERRKYCLIIGLVNQNLKSGELYEGYIPEGGGGACMESSNFLIVSHGNADTLAPMALYFAALMRAVTRSIGANDANGYCAKGSIPNPMTVLEDYLLSKKITPRPEYSLFTECNVKEIEKALDITKCLKQVEKPLCGNAVVDEGEECDCGPDFICQEIDPCCTPHRDPKNQTQPADGKGCKLMKGAKCSSSQSCCSKCNILKDKQTVCSSGPSFCDIGICDGKSADCPTETGASNNIICSILDPSLSEPLLCEDTKCERPLCKGHGLELCTCAKATGKDCVFCCLKNGKCKAAGSELHLLKNGDQPVPDGTSCAGGTCSEGRCFKGKGNRKKLDIKKLSEDPRKSNSTTLYSIPCLILVLMTLHFARHNINICFRRMFLVI